MNFKQYLDEAYSQAQLEAGNYKKEHIKLHGLDIAIENKKGSIRSGTDKDGSVWKVKMAYAYGYIKKTIGADKDQVDVFIGPNKKSEKIFTINQTNPDGSFDEHKVMLGWDTKESAEKGYLASYEKGWNNYSDIIEMDIIEFKEWLNKSSQKKECK